MMSTLRVDTIVDSVVYVMRTRSDGRSGWHLGFVPYVDGVDALCGARVVDARPVKLPFVLNGSSCERCLARVLALVT